MTEMDAIDMLPLTIRLVLNYSAANHSALEVLDKLIKCGDEDVVLRMIIDTDAAMVRGINLSG
jgi:hypothetical protein